MSGSLNKAQLIGFLGAAPVKLFFPSGDPYTRVSVATTEVWKDKKSGEKKERTDWHYVIFIGRLAEVACEYLKKGSYVYVEGSTRTRSYRPAGADRDAYVTEIFGQVMKMLDRKPSDAQPAVPADDVPGLDSKDVPPMDDDIPY